MALYKVHANTFRLARERGYELSDYNQSLMDISVEEFESAGSQDDIRQGMNKLFIKWDGIADYVYLNNAEESGNNELTDEQQQRLDQITFDTEEAEEYLRQVILDGDNWDVFEEKHQQLKQVGVSVQKVLYVHHVYVVGGTQVKVDQVREFVFRVMEIMCNVSSCEAVLVSSGDLTPTANSILKPIADSYVMFLENDLIFPVIDHGYVWKHTKMTEQEKAIFTYTTGTSAEKNPLIKLSDPVVKFYGWKVGDMIRISRDYSCFCLPADYSCSYRTVTL